MVASLVFSFLAHLTVFAASYNWDIQSHEKTDQQFLVELIDLPITPEVAEVVQEEGIERRFERKTVSEINRGKDNVSDHPALLSAHYDSPRTTQSEMKKGNSTSSSFGDEATVSLNSQDLKYVSYLSKIKSKIEPKWHYPARAKKIGLQGKLALCFSILRDGQLDRLEILNSSGQPILDEGALEAVRGAAPYYPLPSRLNISRLNIMATFEYRISPYSMSGFSQSSNEESL